MERKNRLEEYYSMFKDVFSDKNIMAISVSVALWGMMGQGYRPFWALYLKDYLGASVTGIGIFSMISTAESLLFQLPEGLIADRYGRRRLILAGTVFRTLGPVFYLMAPS
jgi:MFS family permease